MKTTKFKNPTYVGDPINAVKIFNEKEVDELVLLDISRGGLNAGLIREIQDIASEAFMPMGFGGGIRTLDDVYRVFQCGFEKVILNSSSWQNPELVRAASREAGAQSVVVCIDVRKNLFGKYQVFIENGKNGTGKDPVTYARSMEELGAGELIIQSIDRDGTQSGYDEGLISEVSAAVGIPVVACGGARGIDDFKAAIQAGASSVAAGSYFVFYGKHRAVLISYPEYSTLEQALNSV